MAEDFFSTGSWEKDEQILISNNVPEEEILNEKNKQIKYLQDNNVEDVEIAKHFGIKEYDDTKLKSYFEENLKAVEPNDDNALERIFSGIGKGFETSSGAMFYRQTVGDKILTPEMLQPEHTDMFYKSGEMVGSLVGDLPFMVAGAAAGTVAGGSFGMGVGGAVAGPVGLVGGGVTGIAVGSFVGANALPAAMRTALMDSYENGEFKSFSDFWSRASSVFVEASKAAAIAGVSQKVGGLVGAATNKVGTATSSMASSTISKIAGTANVSSELATMVTLGSYMEGKVPDEEDFLAGLFTIGGLHLATSSVSYGMSRYGTAKLRKIYAATGKHPMEVAKDAAENPALKIEILDNSDKIPEFYKDSLDPEYVKHIDSEYKKFEAEQTLTLEEVNQEVLPAKDVPTTSVENTKQAILKQTVAKEDLGKTKSKYDTFLSRFQNSNESVRLALDDMEKDTPINENNTYALMNLFDGGVGKATAYFMNGVRDLETGKVVTKSYEQVIRPFMDKGDLADFHAYRVAKRYLEYDKRGLKIPHNLEDLKTIVKNGDAKYSQAAADLQLFKNENLKQGIGELFTKEYYDDMIARNLDHINMKNVVDDSGEVFQGSGLTVKKTVKGQKTANSIQNSFLSDYESVEAVQKAIQIEKIRRTFGEKIIESGVIDFEEIPTTKPKITKKDIEYLSESMGREVDAEEAAKLYSLRASKDLKPNEIEYNITKMVDKDGVPTPTLVKKRIRIADEHLAKVINSVGTPQELNIMLRFLKGFATVKRSGVTELNPSWGIQNTVADTWLNTIKQFDVKNPLQTFGYLKDVLNTIPEIMGRSPEYYKFIETGAGSGNLMDTRELISKSFKRDLSLKKSGIVDKAFNVASDGRKAFAATWDVFDMPNRMATWQKDVRNGKNPTKAAYNAAESSVNFRTKGTSEANNMLSAGTAFRSAVFNATRNTFDTLSSKNAHIASLALITAPYIYSWYQMKDKEDWQKMDNWKKQKYLPFITDNWQPATAEDMPLVEEYKANGSSKYKEEGGVAYINKGNVHKLKMPEVFGTIYGFIPVMILDKLYRNDPSSISKLVEDMIGVGGSTLTGIPTDFGMPILEATMNKSMFRNAPLVPSSVEDGPAEYKYTNYTSEASKAIARLFSDADPIHKFEFSPEDKKHLSYLERKAIPYLEEGIDTVKRAANIKVFGGQQITAPIVIDNFVRQWTGVIGTSVLAVLDRSLKAAGVAPDNVKPASEWADIPFVGAIFDRDFSANTVYISEAQDIYRNEMKEKIKALQIEESKMSKGDESFNIDRYENLIQWKASREEFILHMDTISGLQQSIVSTYADPTQSPDEKRQLINSYYYSMNATAKNALLLYRQIEKDQSELKSEGIKP